MLRPEVRRVEERMTRVGRRPRVAALALGVLLTGCGADAPAAGGDGTPTAMPSSATPSLEPGLAAVAGHARAGLDGSILQFRRDVARHRVEVRLTAANAGLVVDALAVRAPGLSLVRDRPVEAELRPGAGLDLPVAMGEPDCSVVPGPAVAVVGLRDGTGVRRTVEVPLADDGLLARLHAADCADRAVREQADMRVVSVEEVSTTEGPALRVEIRLTRLSGVDPVTVTGTGANTVYTITPVGPLPTLDGGDAVSLVIDMLPSRCDPHGLGESYRTSLIDLVVALGAGAPRPFVLTPDDDVRRRLESFAVDTCRSGG
jgi:hypothetical protein